MSRASLTPAGFALVRARLVEEKVGPVARLIAEGLPTEQQIEFIQAQLANHPTSALELEPLLKAAVQRLTAETERRVLAERKSMELRAASRAALTRCLEQLDQLGRARVEELRELLLTAGGTLPDEQPVSDHRSAPQSKPVTDDDRDFRRDVAERLVSSWRDAVRYNKIEAKGYLETAIGNVGAMRRIGDEGETVSFDRESHADAPGLSPKDRVKVTRSGWRLDIDEDRYYVIEKAIVAK